MNSTLRDGKRDRLMTVICYGSYWHVSTYWHSGGWRQLSDVRVRSVKNLLACISRVSDRPDYTIRIK
jgi:hypothetical protein